MHVPLFVEIEAEACEDESEERHQNSDGHRTAVGTQLRGRRVLTLWHIQTCCGKEKHVIMLWTIRLSDLMLLGYGFNICCF